MSNQTRKQLHDVGLSIRRRVLGNEYVDRAQASATDFNRPFHALLNEYCWGAGWGG